MRCVFPVYLFYLFSSVPAASVQKITVKYSDERIMETMTKTLIIKQLQKTNPEDL